MAPKTTKPTKTTQPMPPVLSTRALNRATLDRQLLLRPAPLTAEQAVHHLVGLQAQNTKPPYYALAARLDGFRPEDLSGLMESRRVARIVSLRSTVHTHTAADAVPLRRLVQDGAIDRELRMFGKGLAGVDLDRLTALTAAEVDERPRTPKELRERLLQEWPDADPQALGIAARCLLPMVQVTPRGLWGRSGQVALARATSWFGGPESASAPVSDRPADLDETVLRYLAAFGPATVKDMQTWCGLTRLRPAFERLRPRLLVFRDEQGTELFDLPDAPRPDADTPAPPRLLPEFDNLLLSHADRTRVVPAAHRTRTWTGNQAHRTFLVDGFLAGIWHLDEGKERTTLTIEPFTRLTKARRDALTAEAERTLRLLAPAGLPYDIRYGDPQEAV
ncbi:winged helix DNA-binding domain-containing protein [Streptomyces sp. SKN60]|uniref:winged helix DNA-binding domain-containing protein n=1 Tax=Streptomyces sp. SKN60 TaxID=2855506 RepID=UPI002246C3B5|nr:winged helix DNA-binding domain-containing protein [Streptomyces sp. SKN60]MCX2185328.1 winged helix DNA-binding domain-containing protein [Streptomyces sp. SKN60]